MSGINSYTKLMLHCNGVDGATTFPDASPSAHVVTANGNAQVDTAQSVFGGASGLFNGSAGTFLSIPNSSDFNFGSGNFTVDFRVRFASTAGVQVVLGCNGSSDRGWVIYYTANNLHFAGYWNSAIQDKSFAWTPSTNTWYHVSVVRNGANLICRINGVQIGATYNISTYTIRNSSSIFYIGENVQETGYRLNGWLDEIRIQNGEAYWTADFTPPVSEYSPDPLTVNIDETINLNDDWSVQVNPEQQTIEEEIQLSDSWDVQIAGLEVVDINEQINLDDDWNIYVNPEIEEFDETVTLDDDWTVTLIEITDYGSQIIWLNPLIIVTNSDPAKISSIDITDPENPVKTTYELIGCKNAKGIVYNATNEYFYVICGEGKVAKVNKNDLEDQTIINTGETDIFTVVDALDTHLKTYAITDDSKGEIVMIDEREVKKINADLRWLASVQYLISSRLDWINGKLINADLRWIANQIKKMRCDLRWIKYEYDEINNNAIKFSDWVVKINGTDLVVLNDVDMDSIQIVHDINLEEEEKGSTVTFILHRKYDRLDYTNAGTSSQITNQNEVVIIIKGITEFTGKISNLSCDDEGEHVTVTAVGTRPQDKRQTVNIPVASLNEQLHLYHCIINKPNIENPYIDTRFLIISDNNKYWNGSSWVSKKTEALLFDNFNDAYSYYDGLDNNYDSSGVKIPDIFWRANPSIRNYEENPPYYKGIIANLGTKIQQNVIRYRNLGLYYDKSLAEQIEDGTFKPMQNWTYFWHASFEHILMGRIGGTDTLKADLAKYFNVPETDINYGSFIPKETPEDPNITWNEFFKTTTGEQFQNVQVNVIRDATTRYLGTSLGSLSVDAWKILFANYFYQREHEDIETELGYYTVGSAPYNEINVKNGKKITVNKWIDKADGLYDVKDESYDYTKYVKRMVNLEYQKLLNINGQIIPRTTCLISLTIDGYYYYNIGLLTRINITNTTTANIYNGNNGFPIAVKTITIKCATQGINTMLVTLDCDNLKSQVEMDELDINAPDENSDEFLFPEQSSKIYSKFDPNSWSYPS